MDPYNAKAIVLDRVYNDPFCVWINQLKITSPDKENAFPAIKVNQVGGCIEANPVPRSR